MSILRQSGREAAHPNRDSHHKRVRGISALSLGVVLASTLLSACGPSANQTAAQQGRAKLDADIHTAQTVDHVPPSLLAPIQAQEAKVTLPANATDAQYAQAASTYKQLDAQLASIEQMPPAQASAQTQKDLTTLNTLISALQTQGYIEAANYAQAAQQAAQQASNAQTTPQYFTADSQIQSEITVVQAFTPTYQALTSFNKRIQSFQDALTSVTGAPAQAGPLLCADEATDQFWSQDPYVNATPQQSSATQAALSIVDTYSQWSQQDLALLRAATTPTDFDHLNSVIAAQNAQLTADQSLGSTSLVNYLVQVYASDITTYQQDGGKDTSFQQQLLQDQRALSSTSITARQALEHTLEGQIASIQLPLLKAKTQHDMQALKQLLATAQTKTTVDPANGQAYPDAYEYADSQTGIGDAEARLSTSQTLQDYQDVDREILMFSTNLSALIQNLNDKTPSTQPHQTDMQLMQYYGITNTRVVVVSVTEQEARFYDNGKLVQSFQVTTGAPDLPSPVGIHCVIYKAEHTVFTSPDPKGSPNWYAPTPINYAMEYSLYGYFLHDAWWRSWFGKYSNLPHWDPAAFNGGSHGCVNFELSQAAWVYNWTSVGTPVILY